MANSTRKPRIRKPADRPKKPYEGFPLTVHGSGKWFKSNRGKLHYFGLWADPDAALQLWLEQKDELLAGRTPRPKTDEITLKELADRFLTA